MRFWPDPLPTPPPPDLGLDFPPAGRHYRAAVSHPSQYAAMAVIQFEFMCRLGLTEDSTLLDIGCGSLRGGRLFIPYLLPGRYFGIEPESWPIEHGIERELGASIIETKAPRFLIDDNFTCTAFNRQFDFILAHSIFSHASIRQMERCVQQASLCMSDTSVFAATYLRGDTDNDLDAWKVPGIITYTPELLAKIAAANGLRCIEYERHPFGQTWILFVREAAHVKPRVEAICADPAGGSVAGGVVTLTLMCAAYGERLASVDVLVNSDPTGSTDGDWLPVDSRVLDGSKATNTLSWDTAGLEPGVHRIGVNLHSETGARWWYEQSPLTYEITAPS